MASPTALARDESVGSGSVVVVQGSTDIGKTEVLIARGSDEISDRRVLAASNGTAGTGFIVEPDYASLEKGLEDERVSIGVETVLP